jgi:hypothetical protein
VAERLNASVSKTEILARAKKFIFSFTHKFNAIF